MNSKHQNINFTVGREKNNSVSFLYIHCRKNHISRILKYHEKFKNTKKISTSINFLDQKKTVFPISENFKARTFPYSKNMIFIAKENIILYKLFESKVDRIFHLRKVQHQNFSIFRKHGIPC